MPQEGSRRDPTDRNRQANPNSVDSHLLEAWNERNGQSKSQPPHRQSLCLVVRSPHNPALTHFTKQTSRKHFYESTMSSSDDHLDTSNEAAASTQGKGGRPTTFLPMAARAKPGGQSPPTEKKKEGGFAYENGQEITFSDLESEPSGSDDEDGSIVDNDYPDMNSYADSGGNALPRTDLFPYNKKSNPVGIFVNREQTLVTMKVYKFKGTGDMFRLNEVGNMKAFAILSAVTKRYRQLIKENSKCRTPMQAIRDVISAYTDSVAVSHKNLELRNAPITNRVTKTFFKILAGYNTEETAPDLTVQDLNPDVVGNMQLRRIGYVFAKIRLGAVGYRHQANRYMAASVAIRSYVKWITKGKHETLCLWFVPLYDLLKGHIQHHKSFELPNHPLGMNETAMPKPSRNKNSTHDPENQTVWQDACSRKTNNGKWWFKERDPEQIEFLQDYIQVYESNESAYFPENSCLVLSEEELTEKRAAESTPIATKRKKRKSTDALRSAPKPIG